MVSRQFPILVVQNGGLSAQGSFAESQAAFLEPDPKSVTRLREAAERTGVGIVAHFYMDPELQGVLASSGYRHVHLSDSLAMADRAVQMAREGARAIIVLGVDFMAENVRAVLDAAGYRDTPVYRVAKDPIGCSLAEAAESDEYLEWLRRAGRKPNTLHVIYINTSLYTKAHAHAIVPTLTCTSSNVVATVLETFARIPDAHLCFGPDTYMGQNLQALFRSLRDLDEAAVKQLHPAHDRESLGRVLAGFECYPRGNCIVHHLFGDDVARRVQEDYGDALVTAHLEVPGAMFRIGLEAQRAGRGVVGSTSDILGFVARSVEAAARQANRETLRIVLGTEAGMVTSLVRRIQTILAAEQSRLRVEIVFPVAEEAVARTDDSRLPVVPGPAAGEGCSPEGGCATCPYMKMNSLDALLTLLAQLERGADLTGFAPKMRQGSILGRPLIEWATAPIRYMR